MNSKFFNEATLSYYAIYDQDLREEMEELGLISDVEEERAPGVKPYKPGPTGAEVRSDAAKAEKKRKSSTSDKSGYGPEEKFKSDWKLRATPSTTTKRKTGETETVSQRMNREKPYAKRMTGPLARKQGSRTASNITRALEGPGEPQAVTLPRMKSSPSKEIIRKTKNEEYDIYDIVLSHLLDEGYASTIENAEAIMANMSENWIESILD
jgi:hypothetical protein